jgi:hypothetical protein
MKSPFVLLLSRTRLLLQESAPYLALLTLPGGYLIAISGLLHRHWPLRT